MPPVPLLDHAAFNPPRSAAMTTTLATIYTLVLLVFILGFLVTWARHRVEMRAYKQIGFMLGGVYVAFELLSTAAGASRLGLTGASVIPLILLIGWGFLRMWAVTNSGIFFANQLHIRSFPLVAPRLGVPQPEPVPMNAASTVALNSSADSINGVTLTDPLEPINVEAALPTTDSSAVANPIEPVANPIAPINRTRYLLTTVGVALGAMIYSTILFALTKPHVGRVVSDLSSVSTPGSTASTLALLLILEVAFIEETIFRLGIQNYLATKLKNRANGYWIAIGLTAVLWTIGHIGSLDPDWVKLVQVFPLGLVLGWQFRKYGAESTILTHGLFNLGMLIVQSSVIT
jgi:hypothetical protein